jgi:hypothetical protein
VAEGAKPHKGKNEMAEHDSRNENPARHI